MALSPADFYAYSRATGAPIPEDPEERVEMAPEVLEFRRNQLKPQQESSNPLAALGTAALGLGALAGVGFGARALMRRGQQIPKAPTKSANAGVRQVNLADMEQSVRRVAAEPAPSKVASRSVMTTEEEAFEQYRRKLASELPEPTAEELNFPAASPRVYGVGYRERQPEPGYRSAALAAFEKKYPPSPEVQAARRIAAQQDLLSAAERLGTNATSLTDLQKIQGPAAADQFINAVESGEDQLTGRVIKKLNIADPWGKATVSPDAINQQQTVPLVSVAEITPQEQAQSFLQTKFEELGVGIPGRYRRERVMGTDPSIAEAAELYASTGDPTVLSRLSQAPSSPLHIAPRVQTEFLEETIPTAKFFQATGRGEFIDDLFEKDIALTNRISSLGEQKQAIANRLEEIDQLEPQLRFAAAHEPEQGGYYTKLLNKMLFEKQSLDPDVINVDLGDALAERDYLRGQMKSLEALGSKYKLTERQEGIRPFFELDPVTGEPIAETLEIRSGRPSVQLEEQKTGGGRAYAMFDPESQTGSSIGIYGIEPRDVPIADPDIRPTALQRQETKMTLRRGDYPEFKTSVTSTPEQKLSSVNMSQAVLKAARQQASRNPRGGVLPDEITMLRRQAAQPTQVEEVIYGPRPTIAPGTVPPQQLGLKGVTGYAARRVDSPADIAANQLEAYMSKLQRGRSTPLTSEAVIQQRLF